MSSSAQDILDFAQDNDVKFVRLAFCDIFGVQKNLAILAEELPYAFDHGIGFDGSSVNGFLNVEESDLLLKPDPSTVTILPWRPMDGRVMRLFCDIYRPNGQPFEGNTRSYLRQVAGRFASLGLTCNVGAECEFYVFELDDRGRPTRSTAITRAARARTRWISVTAPRWMRRTPSCPSGRRSRCWRPSTGPMPALCPSPSPMPAAAACTSTSACTGTAKTCLRATLRPIPSQAISLQA